MAYNREKDWQAVEKRIGGELGREIAALIEELYGVYDRRMLEWFASLWEPNGGGFYYSTPAKETDGFYPDIESTYFVIAGIRSFGMYRGAHVSDVLPEWMCDKVEAFLDSLQDDDGYFYEKHWGKEMSLLRKSRNLTSALGTYGEIQRKPKKPVPTLITKEEAKSFDITKAPERFHSVEAFKGYLESYDLSKTSYHIGSELLSQLPEIQAYGEVLGADLSGMIIEWLDKYKREDTGLWHETLDYYAVNGLHKISWVYNSLGAPISDIRKCAESTFKVIMSEVEPRHVVDVYNPWHSVGELVKNMKKSRPEEAAEFVQWIRSLAPAAIRRTIEKIKGFKQEDGSISYSRDGGDYTSQGSLASPRNRRGASVNGACCGSVSLTRSIYAALDISDIESPLYTSDDLKVFLEIVEELEREAK